MLLAVSKPVAYWLGFHHTTFSAIKNSVCINTTNTEHCKVIANLILCCISLPTCQIQVGFCFQ